MANAFGFDLRFRLSPGDVHLWCASTAGARPEDVRAALAGLPVEERRRYARFRREGDRRDFALAHALLRRTLSAYGGVPPHRWTFFPNEFGKPSLAESHATGAGSAGLAFNLSHTEGFVACVIACEGEVGIDVEGVDRNVGSTELADRYFSGAEAAMLAAHPPSDRGRLFVELWTLKEAYVKAVGRGLSHALNSFTFTFEGPRGLRFDPPRAVDPGQWHFALLAPTDGHRMAVAVQRPVGACRLSAFDDAGRPRTGGLLRATAGLASAGDGA